MSPVGVASGVQGPSERPRIPGLYRNSLFRLYGRDGEYVYA